MEKPGARLRAPLIAALALLALAACPGLGPETAGTRFVPVTGIAGIRGTVKPGTRLDLSAAAVSPPGASNKTIVWSLKDGGGTGVSGIDGNACTPSNTGLLVLTALVPNGKAEGADFIQDIEVLVVESAPVATASDLAAIGSPDSPLSGVYHLTADIALDGWTPIGDRAAPFTGELDGMGFTVTVRGFADGTLAGRYAGIFGYAKGAALTNLGVRAVLPGLEGTFSGKAYAGALIGYAEDTALEGITAAGTLGFTAAGSLSLGGIAGYHGGSAASSPAGNCVKDSVSSVNVSGTAGITCSAGGVNGEARYLWFSGCKAEGGVSAAGTQYNDASGGISGDALYSVYTDCAYSGGEVRAASLSVKNGGMPYAGGIVGRSGSLAANIGNRLLRCSSAGTVSASGPYPYAGGLIGYMHGNSSVSQSYSTAAISGDGNVAYIGGLAGNCSMASLIEDSYYAGTITHAGSAKGIGGIAGQNGSFGSVIRSCYAAGTIAADSNSPVGGIAGENFSAQGNDITRCAALQSAITNAANKASRPRRIAGTLGDLAALTNNIANAAMTLPEASAALDAGPDGLDGAECDAKPGRQVFAETLGWDFAAVWAMGAEGYPVLQWQLAL